MKEERNILISVLIFLVLLTLGSVVYHNVEEWGWLDSVYFVVMTVTTVGYGDLVPLTAMGKIFTIGFSFMGIVFVFYFISVFGRRMFKKHLIKDPRLVRTVKANLNNPALRRAR